MFKHRSGFLVGDFFSQKVNLTRDLWLRSPFILPTGPHKLQKFIWCLVIPDLFHLETVANSIGFSI